MPALKCAKGHFWCCAARARSREHAEGTNVSLVTGIPRVRGVFSTRRGSFELFELQSVLNLPPSSVGKRCWVMFYGVDLAGRPLAGLRGTAAASK